MKTKPALSLSIQYADLRLKEAVSRQQIRRWVRAALTRDAQLTLRFVDAKEGRAINREYRQKDYATNVLTFCYDPLPLPDSKGKKKALPPVEADIILCTDVVQKEAKTQGKTLPHHLAHLIIHGTLHAQGMDHENDSEADLMEARETAILKRFRIADPYA